VALPVEVTPTPHQDPLPLTSHRHPQHTRVNSPGARCSHHSLVVAVHMLAVPGGVQAVQGAPLGSGSSTGTATPMQGYRQGQGAEVVETGREEGRGWGWGQEEEQGEGVDGERIAADAGAT
jgi:hypothetical protein